MHAADGVRVAEQVPDVPADQPQRRGGRLHDRTGVHDRTGLHDQRGVGGGRGEAGEVGGADEAGLGAEGRADDPCLRPVAAPGQGAAERLARGPEQQLACVGHAAADDEQPGVERGGEVRQADPEPAPDVLEAARRRRRPPRARPAVTTGPTSASTSPRTRSSSPTATGEPARASSRASRPRTLPEAYCSRQPRLPHSQRWPSGTTTMCPNSPAIPYRPRCTRPSTTMPPPMPVPSVTMTRWLSPRPAPNRHSAHAAAFASFSTTTGRPSAAVTASRSGSSRQARCGAKQHPGAVGVDEARGADPDGDDVVGVPQLLDDRDDGRPRRARRPGTGCRGGPAPAPAPARRRRPPATFVPPMSMPTESRTTRSRRAARGRPRR